MKTMTKIVSITTLLMAAMHAMAASEEYGEPSNPANGIWIQQVGEIEPQDPSRATLYYTKYEYDKEGDRVKSISYNYNGAGYLLMKPGDRKTLCYQNSDRKPMGNMGGIEGADGIVHHPDGKHLLVAGQGERIHMVRKVTEEGQKCLVKTSYPKVQLGGFWHLMMDWAPEQKWLWAAGIPGKLFRFSTDMGVDSKGVAINKDGFASTGYQVKVKPDPNRRGDDSLVATLIWDDYGRAYFTRSDYYGGGCEGSGCDAATRKRKRANSYFGTFKDTVTRVVTAKNRDTLGGSIGETVITSLTKVVLIDSLEGAHGGTFDKYSGTIFVFGGSKIVQIAPYDVNKKFNPKVVASIDLREYFFNDDGFNGQNKTSGVGGWRLDQGTTDGLGHLFVASNTGHMIFVDFAGNEEKRIDNNVLVHVQWIDAYLDDLAPLVGVGVDRTGGTVGKDEEVSSSSRAGSSSSLVEFETSSSSSAPKSSSSSNKTSSSSGKPGSSDSNSSSSGENPGSSGSNSSSSGENPGSSGSNSSSSGENPGSSGSNSSSSGENPGSSGSNGSSSSGENPGSSGSDDDSSSSKGDDGDGDDEGPSSSSKGNDGDGDDEGASSSSQNLYYGADDEDYDDDDGYDAYPSADAFDKGDTIVGDATILVPTDPSNPDPNVIVIGGNSYLPSTDPADMLDFHYNSGFDHATVGDIVAITLDPDKVNEYFGPIDSLKLVGTSNVEIVDPTDGSKHETTFIKNNDGSVTILVTADEAVQGGSVKIYGNNNVVIIDNINFVDPTPNLRVGYIKDSDGDNTLDYAEVLLEEALDSNAIVEQVRLVVNGDTLVCNKDSMSVNKSRDRILVHVGDLDKLPLAGEFPKDATVLVTYKYVRGTKEDGSPKTMTYVREAALLEAGSYIIKKAYAIRDTNGLDSLFLQFNPNVDLVPADLSEPEMLVLFKETVCRGKDSYDSAASLCALKLDQVKKVYMPTKDIVILVAKDYKLEGSLKDSIWKDSVSLFENKTFRNLQYVTSDEYLREVPVDVVDRFPSILNVEYWDSDDDGKLDKIVAVFDGSLTAEDIDNTLYLTLPWYSNNGKLTYLQAYPYSLDVDPKNPNRVIWDIPASTLSKLPTGVTSISDDLPQATAHTYYSIFGETFISEANAKQVDKMAPVVSGATLSYGKKNDTLVVNFSEPINWKKLKGDDFFAFIHGKDTIDLEPVGMDWINDGFSVKLVLDGSENTILPGDSLLIKHGKKDNIKDTCGNVAGERTQPVVIGGLLDHLVESTNMGSYDANDVIEDADTSYALKTVSSVNLRYMPSSTTKEDMEKQGALGHLVQLGQRFVPQLLDRAQVAADGSYDPSALDSLKPEDVNISFIVNFTDHLGQYVNDTIISVPCTDFRFGDSKKGCLDTDRKVFVNWNFKDSKGRFVGNGVYNVQFKMIVRYKKKKIEEEVLDKWGVRRKKHKRK